MEVEFQTYKDVLVFSSKRTIFYIIAFLKKKTEPVLNILFRFHRLDSTIMRTFYPYPARFFIIYLYTHVYF